MSKLRVLLVDDHAIVRGGLRALCEARGIEVIGEAANGAVAIDEAARTRPDVVVMDLSMPDVDGFEATKKILEALPRTRVLVLTTYASEADAVRAIDAGATGYLLKDAAPDDIVAGIRNVATGASAFTPSVAEAVMRRMRGGDSKTTGKGASLTTRELEILVKVAAGASNKEVAKALRISEATVKTHLLHTFEKLGVDDRTAAVTVAISQGILRSNR